MTKIKVYMILSLIIMTSLYTVGIYETKKQYQDELNKKTKENIELEKDNKFKNRVIEVLLEDRNCECDCGFYEDFYDEFHEKVGAFE